MLLPLILSGCVGEAAAQFKGTVTEAAKAGYSFDNTANPSGNPPIPNARVGLFVDVQGCPQRGKPVAQDGSFEADTVYGGTVGHQNVAVLCFTADGFKSLRLEFPAPSGQTDGSKFLNVTLVRTP